MPIIEIVCEATMQFRSLFASGCQFCNMVYIVLLFYFYFCFCVFLNANKCIEIVVLLVFSFSLYFKTDVIVISLFFVIFFPWFYSTEQLASANSLDFICARYISTRNVHSQFSFCIFNSICCNFLNFFFWSLYQ